MRRTVARRLVLVLLLVLGVLVGAAATLPPAASAASRPAFAADGSGPDVTRLTLTTTLTSTDTTLQSLPRGHTYGWNSLSGTTAWGRRPAAVHFLGDVDYVDGSGPFGGYVTITRANGVRLGFRVSGSSLALPQASGLARALFTGSLDVIEGTGPFRGAHGIGTLVGSRSSRIGEPVRMTFTLTILRR